MVTTVHMLAGYVGTQATVCGRGIEAGFQPGADEAKPCEECMAQLGNAECVQWPWWAADGRSFGCRWEPKAAPLVVRVEWVSS